MLLSVLEPVFLSSELLTCPTLESFTIQPAISLVSINIQLFTVVITVTSSPAFAVPRLFAFINGNIFIVTSFSSFKVEFGVTVFDVVWLEVVPLFLLSVEFAPELFLLLSVGVVSFDSVDVLSTFT